MKRWITALVALMVTAMLGWGLGRVIAQGKMDDSSAKKQPDPRSKALQKAHATIVAEKERLAKVGKYACCLKHPCDWCAHHIGHCPCGSWAASDQPVCNECKGGWAAGDGAIPGKTADDIKTFPRDK